MQDRPRPDARVAHHHHELDIAFLAGQGGAAPALAAFALALSRHRGDDEVLVAVREAERAVELPIDLSANVSARALTERVGDALAAAR
ncbi:MAG TPA: hypothetical protein VFJ16_08810, partial [Longimicrobium sp.]|nr:hypothetical protein [Longimicrobium sp.]